MDLDLQYEDLDSGGKDLDLDLDGEDLDLDLDSGGKDLDLDLNFEDLTTSLDRNSPLYSAIRPAHYKCMLSMSVILSTIRRSPIYFLCP